MYSDLEILVVDDDSGFRSVVQTSLKKAGFSVSEAEHGKMARDMVSVGSFQLVISDIQMSHLTGIELLEWINKFKPVPFILMTGFSQLLEVDRAMELGAKGFLSKPFRQDDLLGAVKTALGITDPSEKEKEKQKASAASFCKVPIEDFVMGKKIPFNIFIRTSLEKFIRIAYTGENIELKRIREYKNKGIEYLYLKKEDYAQLVDFNLTLAKTVSQSDNISFEKKQRFIQYTGEVLLEQIFVQDVDEAGFDQAKDFVKTSLSILTENSTTMDLLNSLNSHSDSNYAHSLGVSVYSVMIAKELKWTSQTTLFRIGLCALFHDIGNKEIDTVLLNKPRSLLSFEERTQIESHPLRGRDILQSLPGIPEEVIMVAYQHHENCLGSGYPNKTQKNLIHPFAKVVSVASIFCEYALKATNYPGMSGLKAMEQLTKFHKDELDPPAFKALLSFIRSGGQP